MPPSLSQDMLGSPYIIRISFQVQDESACLDGSAWRYLEDKMATVYYYSSVWIKATYYPNPWQCMMQTLQIGEGEPVGRVYLTQNLLMSPPLHWVSLHLCRGLVCQHGGSALVYQTRTEPVHSPLQFVCEWDHLYSNPFPPEIWQLSIDYDTVHPPSLPNSNSTEQIITMATGGGELQVR